MKSTLKKPAIAFLVLNVVFFIGWFVLSMLLTIGGNMKDAGQFFAKYLPECFKFLFYGAFTAIDWKSWFIYVLIGLDALFLIFTILGIVLACKRKRARLIWWVIMFALTWLACLLIAFGFSNQYKAMMTYNYIDIFVGSIKLTTIGMVYFYGSLACGFLTLLFGILTYIFGLKWAKRRLLANEVEVPEVNEVDVTPVDPEAQFTTNPAEAAVNDNVVEEVVEEEQGEKFEPMADFMVEPAEIEAQPEQIVVEEIPTDAEKPENAEPAEPALDKNELTSLLRDVVRDIVRDEIARSKADAEKDAKPARPEGPAQPSITGATFGGPLVVQYFNGGINPQSAPVVAPAPAPVAAPAPAPVAPAPAPKAEPAPAPAAPVEKPATVIATATVIAPKEEKKAPVAEANDSLDAESQEKKQIVRIPFQERMINAEKEMKDNYNELKNEFLSWGLHSRVSNSGDTFRLHRKTYCKLTIAGKSLKLYLALDPKDYADSKIPVQDASNKAIYQEIPLIFKVKSDLSLRRAKALIQDAVEKDGLEQGEVGTVNWVKEIKAEYKKA